MLKSGAILLILATTAFAQQQEPTPQPSGQPQVKINYLNVCTPTAEEQAVLKTALAAAPLKPGFGSDFEITRGVATVKDAPSSRFVRLLREFPSDSPLLSATYSISTDQNDTIELLVFRRRDPKDFHQVVLEDRVSSKAAGLRTLMATDTPVSRVKVERLGKGSVGLSRCEGADQSAYEPIFRQASDTMARYRQALGLRATFRSDIDWLSGETAPRQANRPASSTQTQKKPK